jgi:hypothetical protein
MKRVSTITTLSLHQPVSPRHVLVYIC